MKPIQIKVFGERNTGTRAVIRMIDAAPGVRGAGHPGVTAKELAPFQEMEDKLAGTPPGGPWKKVYREAIRDLREDVLGPVGAWKHTAPDYGDDFARFGVRVLFMVRNPYSWVVSLHKRPYHFYGSREASLDEFLRFPWLTMGRDRVDRMLGSPMDLWSLKLKAYQNFMEVAGEKGTPTASLKFEDFVADPSGALMASLKELTGFAIDVRELAEPTKEGGLDGQARKDHYASEAWRQALSRSAVELINERVDWELAENYGYTCLEPTDFD